MKIIVADHSGFCFGVKRAIDIASSEIESGSNDLYSYGPLIHNPQVVSKLENKGLNTINDFNILEKGRIIIRSHGVSKIQEENMKLKGLNVIDTTCPYVKSVHKKVEDYSLKGYNIIIIGDNKHPEVIGIKGYSQGDVYVINNAEEINNLPLMDKICIVSQTTITKEKFDILVNALIKKYKKVEVFNTICKATKDRQESAKEVAQIVDAMVVIGGFSSSNTKKLVEISKMYCENVYHIESIKDLSLQEISKFNTIGVTAGASTPDWIIKEAIKAMDNINNNEMNNEMMEAIESTFTKIHRGDVIKGKIIFVTNNEVMVNINYKSDGIISRDELSSDPNVNPKDLYKEGDDIYVYVIKNDDGEGNVVLSARRVEDIKNWDVLEENFNNKEIVEAKITKVVKGGLIALVKGINGFVPASHISASFVSDLGEFIGKTYNVEIIDFDKEKRRIVLSRKELEKKELKIKRDAVWSTLEENKIIEGTVQRITDFGAFVDLGGVDGLIHISDLSWNRVKHPSEVVKPGDKVEVQVLSFDREKNRISLGLKQTIEEPWTAFINKVNVGDVVEGKIVNLMDFGAFVRLYNGVDGLLHVSQISKDHVAKPSDVLKNGQIVEVRVIDINNEDRKISLSMREDVEEVNKTEVIEKSTETIINEEPETTIEDIINNR